MKNYREQFLDGVFDEVIGSEAVASFQILHHPIRESLHVAGGSRNIFFNL